MKNILVKPLITEKMTDISERESKVGFIVNKNANKIEIRKAIEAEYGVSVVNVNTMNYDGKSKSRYTKAGVISGRANAYKKAIVQLADGDSIDFYENI